MWSVLTYYIVVICVKIAGNKTTENWFIINEQDKFEQMIICNFKCRLDLELL